MKIIIVDSKKYGIKHILVDDEDYELLNKYKWYIRKNRNCFYATRKSRYGVYGNRQCSVVEMHRFILNMFDRKIFIDHIDHNGLNNTKLNLRECSAQENNFNSLPRKNKTSKYKGVHFNKTNNKWRVCVTKNRKRIHIGFYTCEHEAAYNYDKHSIDAYGEFAYLNFKYPMLPKCL